MKHISIDPSAPVLVTGASGYIAGVLIRDLLAMGLTVHGTVRDLKPSPKTKNNNSKKSDETSTIAGGADRGQEPQQYEYLKKLPGANKRLKLFQADLLKGRSYADAMQGCSVVFHMAAAHPEVIQDAYKDVVAPAFKGTKNVLNQAKKTPSVKRVVMTSSCSAMYSDAMDIIESPEGVLDESFWNETATLSYQPLAFAKTEAEKDAWDKFEKQDKWDLITLCPGLVLGPGIRCHRNSHSVRLITELGNGKRGAPEVPINVVDVREVSRAHIEAAFRPEANGRYILGEQTTNYFIISQILRDKYSGVQDTEFPDKPMAKSVLMTFGSWVDREIDRKFAKRSVGMSIRVNASRAERELGISYRPLQETLYDMANQIIDEGLWSKIHMAEEARLAKEEEARRKEEYKEAKAKRKEARLAREKEEREKAKAERVAEKERLREEKRLAKEEKARARQQEAGVGENPPPPPVLLSPIVEDEGQEVMQQAPQPRQKQDQQSVEHEVIQFQPLKPLEDDDYDRKPAARRSRRHFVESSSVAAVGGGDGGVSDESLSEIEEGWSGDDVEERHIARQMRAAEKERLRLQQQRQQRSQRRNRVSLENETRQEPRSSSSKSMDGSLTPSTTISTTPTTERERRRIEVAALSGSLSQLV